MKWLIILLTLSARLWACDNILNIDGKDYKVCRDKEALFSKGCEDPQACFKLSSEKVAFSPNQNPLFSLCYQNGHQPFFAKLEGEEHKVSVCLSENGKVVDLDSLMKAYNTIADIKSN